MRGQVTSRAEGAVAEGRNVRIGPASLFTLVIIVCLSVLAVLGASTAHAAWAMSQRMGTATSEFYQNETAGQELVARMDDVLGGVRAAGGSATDAANAVQAALPGICNQARQAAGGEVEVTASFDGRRVNGEITCHNGRVLKVTVTVLDDSTYRIDRWKMTAVQNEEQPTGSLWTGA